VANQPATRGLSSAPFNGGSVGTASGAIGSLKKGGNLELVLYENVAMGDGRQANNPWLLELPDPIAKTTWDNFVMISPALGQKLFDVDIKDRRQADEYEVHPHKQVVNVKVGNKQVTLPALIIPGMNNDTIAIALGYGRNSGSGKSEDTAHKIGRAAVGAGKNVFPLAAFNGVTVDYFSPDVTISKTAEEYVLAQTQTHASYEGRDEVIKELTLTAYKSNPNIILEERDKELKPWGGLEKYYEEGTLYPVHEKPGIKWGMSIDLNTCFGCGACVVACNAENNIPVVGKMEVSRFHEMHWLRIDRYFSGNPDDPDSIQTVFQPMLCQHCDNAPCENVCPVAATMHNSEGLNQMVYNRCIGTRYCANNCPYKVRRFNWADYMGADSFGDNQRGHISDATTMMNDDLTRMVLNPDVTVRSRGVMEKCSFCVQRLQEGKLEAKKQNRLLTDKDVVTACQQACPANAIVFGNVNSSESVVSRERELNKTRIYYSLEPIHTVPNVNYLAKVRNTDVIASGTGQHDKLKTMETEGQGGH
jgi:molybdopterin-containing oxidoreductase family iron-sulfur binding subunit